MKSGGGGGGGMGAVPSYGVPAKRRWRGLVIAVLGLVILSMLVPLVFLLGLHNGFHSSGSRAPPKGVLQSPPTSNSPRSGQIEQVNNPKTSSTDEGGKSCELTFGSYCLWQQEHRQEMKDALVKKLKDQLFVARAYYPSLAKLPANDKLSRQLKQNIQEMEHMLSESTTDADLPPVAESYSKKMEKTITRVKSIPVVCDNVDKKLRQIFDLTEDEANFHMKQSAFLYKLNVQTMPKSHHCLSLKLTVEYFKSSHNDKKADEEKFIDSSLHHYVIFSNNVLAASVVINSTVFHAKESSNLVFHVLTDGENYYAIKLWFLRNHYKEAAVQVLNVELDSQKENPLLLSLPEDNLNKVVVLDDDVVIQQDLSALWNIDLGHKVNGAVQFCSVKLGKLKSYLGEKGFSQNSCAWMSGLNIIDLVRWRELGLTQTYRKLIKEFTMQEGSVEGIAWRASLLTFENEIYPLNESWVVSGMGHDYTIGTQPIKTASVLHYNGKMKPWLDLGIPQYKSYWKKFLNKEDHLLSECNVNS
ncbi:putative galacturonosyltransferase 7 [Glycine soja]